MRGKPCVEKIDVFVAKSLDARAPAPHPTFPRTRESLRMGRIDHTPLGHPPTDLVVPSRRAINNNKHQESFSSLRTQHDTCRPSHLDDIAVDVVLQDLQRLLNGDGPRQELDEVPGFDDDIRIPGLACCSYGHGPFDQVQLTRYTVFLPSRVRTIDRNRTRVSSSGARLRAERHSPTAKTFGSYKGTLWIPNIYAAASVFTAPAAHPLLSPFGSNVADVRTTAPVLPALPAIDG